MQAGPPNITMTNCHFYNVGSIGHFDGGRYVIQDSTIQGTKTPFYLSGGAVLHAQNVTHDVRPARTDDKPGRRRRKRNK